MICLMWDDFYNCEYGGYNDADGCHNEDDDDCNDDDDIYNGDGYDDFEYNDVLIS